jgi:glycosyltransferase involved in cell wall biosynthesis
LRVAFTLIGGAGWTGGVNYLENLLSALAEQAECKVEAVLFAGADADPKVLARLAKYLVQPPILSNVWNNSKYMRIARLAFGFGLQRDYLAEREFKRANIELVFQHQAWYGCRFKVPTLAWIADFQHRRLPGMFSKTRFLWRELGYRLLSHCATRLMVSSEDAKKDCESYYPKSRGRISVLPFVVRVCSTDENELDDIHKQYDLPEKFFYLPNQLWKHKNHLGVIEALRIIKEKHGQVVVVASGRAQDVRHPTYPQHLLSLVQEYGLENYFRYLGFIPGKHILPLMRLSIVVLNPSFCEGWSTTVEEAKSIGARLLLSDLIIHREQTNGEAVFFDPYDPTSIARTFEECWASYSNRPCSEIVEKAYRVNCQRRKVFAKIFIGICERTIG